MNSDGEVSSGDSLFLFLCSFVPFSLFLFLYFLLSFSDFSFILFRFFFYPFQISLLSDAFASFAIAFQHLGAGDRFAGTVVEIYLLIALA